MKPTRITTTEKSEWMNEVKMSSHHAVGVWGRYPQGPVSALYTHWLDLTRMVYTPMSQSESTVAAGAAPWGERTVTAVYLFEKTAKWTFVLSIVIIEQLEDFTFSSMKVVFWNWHSGTG